MCIFSYNLNALLYTQLPMAGNAEVDFWNCLDKECEASDLFSRKQNTAI